MAVRDVPAESRLRVDHYGKAHSEEWATSAEAEMAMNPRYHWHGEIPYHQLRQVYARCHLLALPSRMEGGANVVSEAVVAGLPVVASRIAGSVGLLGEDYPGFYPVEEAGALRDLLLEAESSAGFYKRLSDACEARRTLFTPEREREGWERLLAEL